MYQTINGFLQTWEYEAQGTQKILDALTDQSLKQEVSPGNRTLGEIAWHLVTSIHVLMANTGLKFESPEESAPTPSSAQEIAGTYKKVCENFVHAINTTWTDDSLQIVNDMFGQKMPNANFLMMLIRHQIHHRGQMTILMRQAGLTVPGVYGPAKEEWAALGMEAPK